VHPEDGVVYQRRNQYHIDYTVSDDSYFGVNRVETYVYEKNKKTGNWVWAGKCFDYTGDALVEVNAYDWEGNSTTKTLNATIK